jgi:hypothetical protein
VFPGGRPSSTDKPKGLLTVLLPSIFPFTPGSKITKIQVRERPRASCSTVTATEMPILPVRGRH